MRKLLKGGNYLEIWYVQKSEKDEFKLTSNITFLPQGMST